MQSASVSKLLTRSAESLKPTTTLFPHQAVDVSLWVKPDTLEKNTSVVGFDTFLAPKRRADAVSVSGGSTPSLRFERLLERRKVPRCAAQGRLDLVPSHCQLDHILGAR